MSANIFTDAVSGVFGNPVSANTDKPDPSFVQDQTSARMDILEPNFSPSLYISNKDQKEVVDTSEVLQIAGNALTPLARAISVSGVEDNGEAVSDQVSVYIIRKGDIISKIAEMYGVSVNTILWANDLKKGEKLVEGDTLFILPVSGVSHTVLKGQTLKGIAKKYNVDVSDIAQLNGVAEDVKLAVGYELIIPDAEILDEVIEKPKNNPAKPIIVKSPLKVLVGYFINPVPEYRRRSQGLHGKNGVDLAAPVGTPIVASASGKVLLARVGYNGGYGNMVIINHPNGTQTLYGHMVRLGTSTGKVVNQGEVIGYVGSTGRSTGPHIHFEVHGARNPAVDL